MSEFRFQKLPRSILGAGNEDRLVELTAESIRAKVEVPLYRVNADRVAGLPPEAQTVYWLWLFICEASCGLMDVFILEPLGKFAPQIHAALTAVGAKELLRLMEAAIPLARESGVAEFTTLTDQSWFNQFAPNPEFPTLQSTNAKVYGLIKSLRWCLASDFIRSNARALFEDSTSDPA
jgi:hypothetical protein